MQQLSFKNRIASLYIFTTALLIAVVFIVIYFSVTYNVYSHINDDITSESQKHLTEIAVSNNDFHLIHQEEWMEREHNTVDVNPVFVQFIDENKNVVEKSPNLKSNLQFQPKIPFNELFDYQLDGKSLRQIQLPIFQGKTIVGYLMVAMSLENSYMVLNDLLEVLLIAYPSILVILFLIARLIAGRSIKPISSIINTSNAITKDNLKAVSFGDSDRARVGDWVVAIGNPFGLGGTVTAGIISARNRDISLGRYDDFIQTDAAINVGNSGGPLFNLKGEVVGINSAILSNSGGSVGIGFAIPSNLAKNVIDQIINTGEIKRGYIGVRIQEVTKEIADSLGLKNPEGALISSAATDGPANKAGIQAGDVILEFNNIKVENYRRLQKIVAETPIGKNVDVKIWRNKQIITRNIKVARLEETVEGRRENNKQITPTSAFIKELGIKIRNIANEDIEKRPILKDKKGVFILEIKGDGPLALLPIQEGEVITAVGNNPVFDIKNFEDQFKKEIRKNTNSILLTIFDSNNQSKFIGVKIK